MKLFSFFVFAVHGVSGLLSETTIGNDQQKLRYIVEGQVIETAEQYADAFLKGLSRSRGSSVSSFVQKCDIDFAEMYCLGLPNAREYLKALWDCGTLEIKDGRVELDVALKDILAKFGIPDAERKAVEAKQMKRRKSGFFTMIESLLFIHGKVPFAEYSAIWDGPPARNLSLKMTELNKILQQRPSDEKHSKSLLRRYNDFLSVLNKTAKRPAEGAPGPAPAPAAKRARPTAVCQHAQSSFQKLLCEHAKFQEEIASLKSELHTKNQRIGELDRMCDHHNLVGAKLQSELQSKDQYHEKCQAELRAELQGKIDALIAQNQQLQQENAVLRQQRPPVVIKTEPGIKPEIKPEHFDIKPEPQQ